MQAPPAGEPLKINLEATTGVIGALVKYLYKDVVDKDDITEDLIALASKYNLTQLKVSTPIPWLVQFSLVRSFTRAHFEKVIFT